MSVQTYANFINGEWVAGRLGRDVREPQPGRHQRPGRPLRRVERGRRRSGRGRRAAEAYTTWRLVPAPKRAEILFRAAQLFAERKEAFARDMTREMGKVLDETRGDVQEAIDMTHLMAGEGRRLLRPDGAVRAAQQVRDVDPPADRRLRADHAWNFPMAIPSWKIIPALVCGNTVVLQAGRGSAALGLQLRADARRRRRAARRRQHRDRRRRRRRRAARRASRRPRRLVHRIDRDRPARQRGRGAGVQEGPPRDGRQERRSSSWTTPTSSWRSTAACGAASARPGSAAPRPAASSSTRRSTTRSSSASSRARSALRVGDGLDPAIQMGPSISEAQLQKVMDYVEIGKQRGRDARDRRPSPRPTAPARKGFFHEPTIFTDVTPTMRIARRRSSGRSSR